MTENQERALLPLVSALKAHGVDLVTIDEVMDLWATATHGMRFVMPEPRRLAVRKEK